MKILLASIVSLCLSFSYGQSGLSNPSSIMFDSIGSLPDHVTFGKYDDGSWSFQVVDSSGCIVAYQDKEEKIVNVVDKEEALRIIIKCFKWQYERDHGKRDADIKIKDSIKFWNCLCFVGCNPRLGGQLVSDTKISGDSSIISKAWNNKNQVKDDDPDLITLTWVLRAFCLLGFAYIIYRILK